MKYNDRPDAYINAKDLEIAIVKATSYGDALDAVREAPNIEIPAWIPCSERLPSIGEKVLVSTKKTCFVQVFKGIYSDPTRWLWEHNSIKKIDAWMPLPEAWKGADDDTD